MAQLVENLPAMQETWVAKILGDGKGYPLQYSGLENSRDCIVHGVPKSWAWLSDLHFHFLILNFFCIMFSLLLILKFSFFIEFWQYWVSIAACGLSLVAGSEGYPLVTVLGFLIAVASPVAGRSSRASVVVAHGLH